MDHYESIDCAYNNTHRWIGGMDLPDGVRVEEVTFLDLNNANVYVVPYNSRQDKYLNKTIYSDWGNSVVKLKKINGVWKITFL